MGWCSCRLEYMDGGDLHGLIEQHRREARKKELLWSGRTCYWGKYDLNSSLIAELSFWSTFSTESFSSSWRRSPVGGLSATSEMICLRFGWKWLKVTCDSLQSLGIFTTWGFFIEMCTTQDSFAESWDLSRTQWRPSNSDLNFCSHICRPQSQGETSKCTSVKDAIGRSVPLAPHLSCVNSFFCHLWPGDLAESN